VSHARRELSAAVLGSVVAGALALITGGQVWATAVAERPPPLPPVESTITGAEAAPLVPAAGLVLLAAAVALVAVRGLARAAVGLLVAVAGGVLVWSGGQAQLSGLQPAGPSAVAVELADVWPVLAACSGVLAAAVGGLVVVRGRSWPGMGRRYERPGAETPTAAPQRSEEDRAQDAWKALDRGEDPTDGEAAAPRTRPV
jgi:uncharacterized membrane protein (TIGR02234 family)